MKILQKTKILDVNIFDTIKTNKMNRFFKGQITDAVIESLSEEDFLKKGFEHVDESLDYQTKSFHFKNDVIMEKMISDLLNPFKESIKTDEQTILFYDNSGKLESVLTMEIYNEIILSGSANKNLKQTEWLFSSIEQINSFKNSSAVFRSTEINTEEFCQYEDVTNEN